MTLRDLLVGNWRSSVPERFGSRHPFDGFFSDAWALPIVFFGKDRSGDFRPRVNVSEDDEAIE
ncbi:MAG: hypothetical protein GY866_26035 [Proteobacteria bacterium]|nr:hypothetical protein [Pseudomonadota bacterium]